MRSHDDSTPSSRLASRSLVAVGLATLAATAGMVLAARSSGTDIMQAVADPQETTGSRTLGIVSNVGVLTWAATIGACMVAAAAAGGASAARREWRAFFVASTVVCTVLLIDDFLLVHEFGDDVLHRLVGLDASRTQKDLIEASVFGLYAIGVAVYARRFRRLVLASDLRLLAVAVACAATSVIIDFGGTRIAPGVREDLVALVEESFKLLGLVYLALYYFRTAVDVVGDRDDAGDGAPGIAMN